MERLNELVSLCNASINISINLHKDFYQTVEKYIDAEDKEDIDNDVFDEMVKRDTIVKIHFYPDTPIGCFIVYHYDINKAIEIALGIIKK